MNDLTWSCHFCNDIRSDDRISVFKRDISAKHGLPPGTMISNLRYCNDRMSCFEGVQKMERAPLIASPLDNRGGKGP